MSKDCLRCESMASEIVELQSQLEAAEKLLKRLSLWKRVIKTDKCGEWLIAKNLIANNAKGEPVHESENRKIAEALGWRFLDDRWHVPECKCGITDGQADMVCLCPGGELVNCRQHLAFDPFTSEEASAMLMEAMPEPDLWQESTKGERRLWGCHADVMEDENGKQSTAFHADRKTAIALAFIALVDSGWRMK